MALGKFANHDWSKKKKQPSPKIDDQGNGVVYDHSMGKNFDSNKHNMPFKKVAHYHYCPEK